MIHLFILAAALLHLQDPAGDAVGDGSLTPPTAPVYANTSDFDLQSVTVTDDAKLTVRVTLGSLTNPGNLPNGFSNPVVEVYLDTESGGAHALLPGSTLTMPAKHGWDVALRLTGDQAYAVTPRAQGDPASWPHLPATLQVEGNTLVVRTDLPRPEHADVYAITGVYDPFSQDGWRALSTSVSPWAFSSDSQRAPVVDVLANGMAAQRRAIDSGTLVTYRSPMYGVGWLLLMVLGLIVAAAGAVLRRRVPGRAPARPIAALPPPRDEASHRRPPSFWDDMPPTEPSFLDELEEASLWPDADASVAQAAEGDGATAWEDGDAAAGGADEVAADASAAEAEIEDEDAPEPEEERRVLADASGPDAENADHETPGDERADDEHADDANRGEPPDDAEHGVGDEGDAARDEERRSRD